MKKLVIITVMIIVIIFFVMFSKSSKAEVSCFYESICLPNFHQCHLWPANNVFVVLLMHKGWNLISIPANIDYNAKILLNFSAIYMFNNKYGYVPTKKEDLKPNVGYFVFAMKEVNAFLGYKVKTMAKLEKGWNLIGPGCVESVIREEIEIIYSFDGESYVLKKPEDKLKPCNGYWVLKK